MSMPCRASSSKLLHGGRGTMARGGAFQLDLAWQRAIAGGASLMKLPSKSKQHRGQSKHALQAYERHAICDLARSQPGGRRQSRPYRGGFTFGSCGRTLYGVVKSTPSLTPEARTLILQRVSLLVGQYKFNFVKCASALGQLSASFARYRLRLGRNLSRLARSQSCGRSPALTREEVRASKLTCTHSTHSACTAVLSSRR